MSELFHECGLAAVYHLAGQGVSPLVSTLGPNSASRLVPGMLLDMQNRGQLAAGMSTFHPGRDQLLVKWKNVGSVTEVFIRSLAPTATARSARIWSKSIRVRTRP